MSNKIATSKPTSSRTFTFKVNIPLEEHLTTIERLHQSIALHQSKLKYVLLGGIEIAPTTGLRHAHGYVEFNSMQRLSSIPNILGFKNGQTWVRIKTKHESKQDLINHHTKLDSKLDPKQLVLVEWPTNISYVNVEPKLKKQKIMSNGKIEKQRHILELTTKGDIETIKNLYPGDYLRLRTNILAENKKLNIPKNQIELTHYWIHGKPGTGKNAICKLLFPDAFIANSESSFWDGYTDQKQIIYHDMDPRSFKKLGHKHFKLLTDGFTADIKHSAQVYIKAQIIITSNFTIQQCINYASKTSRFNQPQFTDMDEHINQTDYEALTRSGRYIETPIRKFLFQNNLQLKPLKALEELKKQQNGDVSKCFEPYDLEHKVPGPVYEAMGDLSKQLHSTNNQLVQSGYIQANPFPRTLFHTCESSQNVQVWKSDAYTLVIHRVEDPERDGDDKIEIEVHPRTPESSEDES